MESDFFVSYTKNDGATAEWIADQLHQAGYRVAFQSWHSVPGTHVPSFVMGATAGTVRTIAVLSPDYERSKWCEVEWRGALDRQKADGERRLIGVRIADYRPARPLGDYGWIDLVGLAGPERRTRLLDEIRRAVGGHSEPPRNPLEAESLVRSLPVLANRFVPRPETSDRIRASMVRPGPGVIGLSGMGGTGKSTLARALFTDAVVADRFGERRIWLDAGPSADPLDCQRQLAAQLGSFQPITDVQSGRNRVRRLVAHAPHLVALDDVWDAQIPAAFPLGGESVLLVTTRDRAVLDPAAAVFPVDTLDASRSRQVLASWAGVEPGALPVEAYEVVTACGGLPLALAAAGGLAGKGTSWATVRDRLRDADRAVLPIALADYPAPNLLAAFDIGVAALPDAERDRYRDLAVFAGLGPIPVGVCRLLWARAGLDEPAVEDLLVDLAGRSLLRIDPMAHTFALHDLHFDYLTTTNGMKVQAELHAAVATALLEHWGGLSHGLPGTTAASFGSDPADGYGLRHLADHLLLTGRPEVLHRVLAASTRSRPSANTWFAAHERAGTVAAYLTDLDKAQAAAVAAGTPVPAFDHELRYLLLRASTASVVGSVSPPMLAALVRLEIWDPSRALAYARAIPSTYDRVMALCALVSYLPAVDRPAVATAALTAAAGPGDPATLMVLSAIPRELTPYLTTEQQTGFLQERLAAAGRKDGLDRAEELQHLAAGLPPDRRAAVLSEALAAAREDDPTLAVRGPHVRAQILVDLAEIAPPSDRESLLRRGLDAIDEMRDDVKFTLDLHDTLRCLRLMPEKQRARLVRRTLTRVRRLSDPADRGRWLFEIGALTGDHRVMQEALNSVGRPADARTRGAFVDIIEKLPGELRASATAVGYRIDDPIDRCAALLALAPGAAEVDRPSLVADALDAAHAITDRNVRARGLVSVASFVPDDRARTLVAEALAVTRQIGDAAAMAPVLAALGARLPGHIADIAFRSAIAAARTDPGVSVLTKVARHLPGPERAELAAEALAMCEASSDAWQVHAMTDLIPILPADLLPRVQDHLLGVEKNATDPSWQSVGGIVWAALAARRPAQALPAAMTKLNYLVDGLTAERAVRSFEAELSPPQAIRLVADADQEWGWLRRVLIATLLVERMPPDRRPRILREARRAVDRIDAPELQAQLLRLVAAATTGTRRLAALAEALARARELPPNRGRVPALSKIAPLLAGEASRTVITEAMRAAIATDDVFGTSLSQVAEAASALAQVGWAGFWRPLLTRAGRRGRRELAAVLTAAVPEIALTGGESAINDVLITVLDVLEWLP